MEVPDVDADVDDLIADAPGPMNVATQRQIVRFRSCWALHDTAVIGRRWVVVEPTSDAVNVDDDVLDDVGEVHRAYDTSQMPIVISAHEDDAPVKPSAIRRPPIGEAHREVAEVVDGVAGSDDLIPALSQVGVHGLDISVGPVRIRDDVRVPEVGVGG